MGRFKKRVQKKKAVKKVVHRKQTEQKKTPEQQARENEMLKMMLGRQQQIIPGQTQQNDKLQQQLDTVNRRNYDLVKEQDTLKSRIAEITSINEQQQKEMQQMKDDFKRQKQINKIKEKNNKEKEEEAERLAQEKDKSDELDKAARKFDEKTEEGKHYKKMNDLEDKKREYQRAKEDKQKEIDANKYFAEEKKLTDEIDKLQAEISGLDGVLSSDEYVKAREKVIEKQKEFYIAQQTKKHKQALIDKEMEIAQNNTEAEGYQRYLEAITAPGKVPVYNKDGTIKYVGNKYTSQIVYQKNQNGKFIVDEEHSILNLQKQELAEQEKRKHEAEINRDEFKTKYNNARDLMKKTIQAQLDADNIEAEQKAYGKYLESTEYKGMIKKIETHQEALAKKEEAIQLRDTRNEQQKRLIKLQQVAAVKEKFDPLDKNAAEIAAQINAGFDESINRFEDDLGKIVTENQRKKVIGDINADIEKIQNRYDNEHDKKLAFANIFRLVKIKTEDKLGNNNPEEYNLANLKAFRGLTHMLSEFDKEALTKEEKLQALLETDDFKDTPWDTSKTNQED